MKAGIRVSGWETGAESRREVDRLGGEVDRVDLVQLAGSLGELCGVVENLDPVAGREAQHLVAAQALDGKLTRRIAGAVGNVADAKDAGDDRAVVARPFERRAAVGKICRRHGARFRDSQLVNLYAVELVLQSHVRRSGGQSARARRSRRPCAG